MRRRPESHQAADASAKALRGLLRKTQDEITRDGEARGREDLERRGGAGRIVPPPDRGELRVFERLDSDGDPVDAGVRPGARGLRRHVLGIRLDRHFGPGLDPERVREGFQEPVHGRRRKKRRRPAAEVHRVEDSTLRLGREDRHLALQRLQIAVAARSVRRDDERAVAASGSAVREVDVDTAGRAHRSVPMGIGIGLSAASAHSPISPSNGNTFRKLPSRTALPDAATARSSSRRTDRAATAIWRRWSARWRSSPLRRRVESSTRCTSAAGPVASSPPTAVNRLLEALADAFRIGDRGRSDDRGESRGRDGGGRARLGGRRRQPRRPSESQSFEDAELAAVGRRHDAAGAGARSRSARRGGPLGVGRSHPGAAGADPGELSRKRRSA